MKTAFAVLGLAALLAFQSCKSPGSPSAAGSSALIGDMVGEAAVVTIRAWVEVIDKTNRALTLKGPRGGTVTLEVKDVKTLDAMAVGDPVVAAYMEALAVQVKRVPGVSGQEVQLVSKAGQSPSATVGREVVVTTMITGLDKRAQTVTIKVPGGNTETIKVKHAVSLQGLDAGDMAELTYTQALAITIDRAGL